MRQELLCESSRFGLFALCFRRRPNKKPAGEPAGCPEGKWKAALRERFWDFSAEVDGVRMIPFYADQLVASLQHAIELVDQH